MTNALEVWRQSLAHRFPQPVWGQDEMLKELREKVHPGKKMKMIQAAPSGGKGVVEW